MAAPGDLVAGYALGRMLGRGGSGAVHLAWDMRFDRAVAIKLLSLDARSSAADQADLRECFAREAQITMRIRHPGVVQVFESGSDAGQLWQAMELVQGHPLSRYAQPRLLLPPALVLDVGIRIAQALEHVHGLGIVHRDLKPSNVLVDLPRSIVKVSDFGTARLLDGSRTRTGVMLGTPAYMAPEQLAGGPATASGDLYSLAVMLFELLTGRLPHEAASMGQFLRLVASEPAPDLRTLWPQAPEAVAQTLAIALARQPSERTSDAAALAYDLGRARLHAWGPAAVT